MKPDFQIKKVKLYNCDNMIFMKEIPDNHYDLAIVDPEYGIGAGSINFKNGTSKTEKEYYRKNDWDLKPPPQEYFDELFRISKNQIIWGANYMIDKIVKPSMGWIYWDKMTGNSSYSDGELAFTSFDRALRSFRLHTSQEQTNRIHPTQKPVALYKWILSKYAEKGNKIIDTHGGSCSLGCACMDMDFDIDICEIDKKYFDDAVNRLKNNVQDYFAFV